MTKKSLNETAAKVLELVGGKENISHFTHCITRLRFNVIDKSEVDEEGLKKVAGILGAQWSGEQYQIIIGQDVDDLYKEICEVGGIKVEKAIDENLDGNLTKDKFSFKKIPSIIVEVVSTSIMPFIPVLIGAGMISVLRTLLNLIGVLSEESMTYQILSIVSDVAFYFIPVFVGKGAAKKFGVNEGLGIFMGLLLVSPSLAAMVDEGTKMSIFGIPIYAASYSYLVFPAILCVAAMAPIEKFFARISPKMLRSTLEPTCTILVMIPLALCLLAPLGTIIGNYIGTALVWLYETAGFIGVAVLGMLYPLLVVTGMHWGTVPYWFETFATKGFDPLVSIAECMHNITQGAAAFAVALKTKDDNLKSTALSCGTTAIIGGISEPSLFGVNLRLKKPLIASVIGNAVGCGIAGIAKVTCNAIYGSGGILAIPCFAKPGTNNLLFWVIAIVAGAAITFVITYLTHVDEED